MCQFKVKHHRFFTLKLSYFQLFLICHTFSFLFSLFCFLNVYASEVSTLQTSVLQLNKTLLLFCHYRLR